MADKGTFIIDETIPEETREEIIDRAKSNLVKMKDELAERETKLNKRRDFFEGNHQRWTNVVGLTNKQQAGHIVVAINYIYRFCQKVAQALTNTPPRIEIKSNDESNEVETVRSEAVEEAIYDVLKQNQFFKVVFKRLAINQVRDGDFVLSCRVVDDKKEGKKIVINHAEQLNKIHVGWDDAAGTSFSFIAYRDMWSLSKIKREYDYDADPIGSEGWQNVEKGSHDNDQYGLLTEDTSLVQGVVPSGDTKLPKAEVVDYWGYEIIDGEEKVVNIIFINKEAVQFVATDYVKNPWFVGHSFIVAGKPWSMSFIDPLIDAQVELNDRTGEEGDLVRSGAHIKYLAINMPDFDADSVTPGSGQVIFIEGENADFRPLQPNISNIPSQNYINRMLEHMFTLGIPKIALASGTAPYTGRVGAIQYQPFADLINDLRIQWEVVLEDLIKMIQQYLIDYFPETHSFMREAILNEDGSITDGELIIRDVEFDWENVLPLSRSDKVVDASTLRDRHAISLHSYLKEAGFRNPNEEIKKLKKETNDPEMMAIMEKFSQFSRGATEAQAQSQKILAETEEEIAEQQGVMSEQIGQAVQQATQGQKAPVLSEEQNDGRRGVLSASGTPTGQTASLKGSVTQSSQNMNAKAGV